ncbi:hypothetical protein KIN20_021291 [Parelaphostrongylus tenuis]|uniref:Uncharacterized protein n=1 Tax=Parelaphostrongylus tenuis TaxID=148309 RepID=A0AAD5N6Y0_PARTN|nr:hypothetical protein KIN20_021291 [Parelaphostrongylus tenuis]
MEVLRNCVRNKQDKMFAQLKKCVTNEQYCAPYLEGDLWRRIVAIRDTLKGVSELLNFQMIREVLCTD